MKLRSLLFVPADRPERFGYAAASKAHAIILDLEDSVAPERKSLGREGAKERLASEGMTWGQKTYRRLLAPARYSWRAG